MLLVVVEDTPREASQVVAAVDEARDTREMNDIRANVQGKREGQRFHGCYGGLQLAWGVLQM